MSHLKVTLDITDNKVTQGLNLVFTREEIAVLTEDEIATRVRNLLSETRIKKVARRLKMEGADRLEARYTLMEPTNPTPSQTTESSTKNPQE